MVRAAVAVGAALTVPLIGVAAAAAGLPGALGAAVGLGLVVAMFGMSGVALAWAARLGPEVTMAVALGGVLLRFIAYGLLLVLLGPVEAVHKPSLAIATAVALIVTLAYEVRLVSRQSGFFNVQASAGSPASLPGAVTTGPAAGGGLSESSGAGGRSS